MDRKLYPVLESIDPNDAVYVISVVSELVGLPQWTLRALDKAGVVCAKRSKGNNGRRLYCFRDIKKLEYVKYLMRERGVNIEGVKVILEIKKEDDKYA